MSDLSVIGPRVARTVKCPYCRHDIRAICRKPVEHDTLQPCTACGGTFVVRFHVEITPVVHTIEGEHDRIADEQRERLELERRRKAEGVVA